LKKILIIGPAAWSVGGIATVNESIRKSVCISGKYEIILVPTWDEKKWIRLFMRAITSVLLRRRSAVLIHFALSTKGSTYRKLILLQCIGDTPYIVHIHSGRFCAFYRTQPRYVQRRIEKMLNNASRVICVSNTVSNEIREQFHLDEEKCVCIYNGVEVNRGFVNKRKDLIKVLYMGSLISSRCIDEYLALSDSFRNEKRIRFYVAGDGEREDRNEHTQPFLALCVERKRT